MIQGKAREQPPRRRDAEKNAEFNAKYVFLCVILGDSAVAFYFWA
jgi:hypothetical protein